MPQHESAGRILVVDDEEENIRELVAMGLRYEGFDVAAEADGHAAMREVRSLRPDLIVLDVMLPGVDGFEVCPWRGLREPRNGLGLCGDAAVSEA